MSNEASLAGNRSVFGLVLFIFLPVSLKAKGRLARNKVCSLEPTKLQDTTRSHV